MLICQHSANQGNQVLNPFVKRYDEDGNEVSKGITLNPFKKDFYTQTGLGNQTETWDKNKDYQKGSMVKYIGDTYEAIKIIFIRVDSLTRKTFGLETILY